MVAFRDLGRRTRQRMRTLDGKHFYGRISQLQDSVRQENAFYIPRRILSVHPSCHVKEGDVVFNREGRAMLLGWNGDLEHHGTYARTYKLYDLDRELSWKRMVVQIDPVTKLTKTESEVELGPLLCSLELDGQVSDTLQISQTVYRLLCAEDVQVGDTIDDHLVVRRVEKLTGVVVAEVT